MLVLSRKCSESIQIGPDVRITIVRIDRSQVRLGIEAPGDVCVLREELFVRAEGDESAATRRSLKGLGLA
jgi:carbon storage regulator